MKEATDFTIVTTEKLGPLYSKLALAPSDGRLLPPLGPGQFVQVAIEAPGVFLRRPISVCDADVSGNLLYLLVRRAGKGTEALCDMEAGSRLNILLPLGKGFSLDGTSRPLLVGGGVGVAPLLYLGKVLSSKGIQPTFMLGARSEKDLLLMEEFEKTGLTLTSTEDGSHGEKGLVTVHSAFGPDFKYDRIYCCGPSPMMKAVAALARNKGVDCEVSLENMMACGLGACLCCVENTVKGNVCVCTEGPVFNINSLNW